MASRLPLLLILFLLPFLCHASPSTRCLSTTLSVTPLTNLTINFLNPHLPPLPLRCSPFRPSSTLCNTLPSLGSGLAQLSPTTFLFLTDNGPTTGCDGKEGTEFHIPAFAPSLAVLRLDAEQNNLRLVSTAQFRGSGRKSLASGLPPAGPDTPAYGPGCVGKPLKRDPRGIDPEDLAPIPGTRFAAIVEEYGPSVLIADWKTGRIAARHVPKGSEPAFKGAGYKVVDDLPGVYRKRRNGRGFEAVVVDAEGKYVIAIMQSPMLGDDEGKTENNSIIRCAVFALRRRGERAAPLLKYTRSFVIEASPVGAYMDASNKPKDLKYSAAQYRSPGKFLALERAKGQVKIFLVDWTKATDLDGTRFANSLALERATNGVKKPEQLRVVPAEKTLVWDSAPGVGGSVRWTGSDKQEGFVVDVDDPTKMWMVDDNDFGIGGNRRMQLREIKLGRSVTGATVCGTPRHPPSPKIDVVPSKKLRLVNSQTYRVLDEPDKGGGENLDVDEDGKRAYVANSESRGVDMYDISTSPATPLKSYVPDPGYMATSVAVCKAYNFVAVGLTNNDQQGAPGRIDVLTTELVLFRKVQNKDCILVDDVEWSPDCNFLLGACEGEGRDVPGGVLVADFAGPSGNRFRSAKVAHFKAFDPIASILKEKGVRLVESDVPSVDLEPEYITIIGKHAFVTLQEANAIAVVDLFEAKVTELKPIGFIDRSRRGFGLDASDKDDKINIRNYRFLFGMPQPDAISKYVAGDGEKYLVFVNEGDSKDDVEEARGEDITDPGELGRIAVPGLKRLVEDETLLGRLKFSTIMGYNKSTNTQEKMFHFGSRSFSIMKLDGTVLFDSGEWFARIQQSLFKDIFNSNGLDDEDFSKSQADLFDSRSDDKGAEPESLSLLMKGGKTFAFIGLERPSIIVVFDITDPKSPSFVDAVQNHPFNEPAEKIFAEGRQGDIDPEGVFASAKLGKLFVSGSVSSTLSSYDIKM